MNHSRLLAPARHGAGFSDVRPDKRFAEGTGPKKGLFNSVLASVREERTGTKRPGDASRGSERTSSGTDRSGSDRSDSDRSVPGRSDAPGESVDRGDEADDSGSPGLDSKTSGSQASDSQSLGSGPESTPKSTDEGSGGKPGMEAGSGDSSEGGSSENDSENKNGKAADGSGETGAPPAGSGEAANEPGDHSEGDAEKLKTGKGSPSHPETGPGRGESGSQAGETDGPSGSRKSAAPESAARNSATGPESRPAVAGDQTSVSGSADEDGSTEKTNAEKTDAARKAKKDPASATKTEQKTAGPSRGKESGGGDKTAAAESDRSSSAVAGKGSSEEDGGEKGKTSGQSAKNTTGQGTTARDSAGQDNEGRPSAGRNPAGPEQKGQGGRTAPDDRTLEEKPVTDQHARLQQGAEITEKAMTAEKGAEARTAKADKSKADKSREKRNLNHLQAFTARSGSSETAGRDLHGRVMTGSFRDPVQSSLLNPLLQEFSNGGFNPAGSLISDEEELVWKEKPVESKEAQESSPSELKNTAMARLVQMPVANLSIRKSILPGITQRVMPAAGTGKNAGIWQKHNFVLDDGRNLQLSSRQVEGVLQVKIGSSNTDLNRLLLQHQNEIREHLENECGMEVELQFDNRDEKEFAGFFGDPSSGSHQRKAPSQPGKEPAVGEADDVRTTSVRSFGYNRMEWTA